MDWQLHRDSRGYGYPENDYGVSHNGKLTEKVGLGRSSEKFLGTMEGLFAASLIELERKCVRLRSNGCIFPSSGGPQNQFRLNQSPGAPVCCFGLNFPEGTKPESLLSAFRLEHDAKGRAPGHRSIECADTFHVAGL